MLIVAGRTMSISDAAREGRVRTLEVAITDIIKRWAVEKPHELARFDRQQRFLRGTLHKNNAMSSDGDLLHKGEIPASLYFRMCRGVHNDWIRMKSVRNLFFRIFKIGCINKTSETSDKWHKAME